MPTVMVVDDEEGFRHIMKVILQRAGYQTQMAGNALEAQRLMDVGLPDLLILDDMMPGMSGSDLCRHMKRDARLMTVPVIMHSANSKLHNADYVQSIGADGVLLKPCTPREILDTITQFLHAQA